MRSELQAAAKKGIEEMTQFYDIQSNYILNKGALQIQFGHSCYNV